MFKPGLLLILPAFIPGIALAGDAGADSGTFSNGGQARCKIVVGMHVNGKPDFVRPAEGSSGISWSADNSAIQSRHQLPPYSVWYENCHGIDFYFATTHASQSETALHRQPEPVGEAKVQ
jgi:hypothetical protein